MLSKPYPSKGTARNAAKEAAKESGFKMFILLLDLDKRQYHFSDQEKPKDSKLIVFARYALIKDKWRDKTPLGKVVCGGNVTETKRTWGEAP